MEYFIPCPCGHGITVTDGAAGSRIQCRCGQPVTVPSFRELRHQAGVPEPAPSPELVVEAMLLAQQLPEERECVLCGTATDASIRCRTVCELAQVESGEPPWWQLLFGFATFGILGALLAASNRGPERETGKDRIFELPLRICEHCGPRLSTERALLDALCRVPVYRRLLREYPDADITRLA